MRLGINAFNIRRGGGVTHLVELLAAANPEEQGFFEVIVWAPNDTLNYITNKAWLVKKSIPTTKSWFFKIVWLIFTFRREAKECDILLIPGGSYFNFGKPYVTMLQNMLPFDAKENKRYFQASIKTYIKCQLLALTQRFTLKKSMGAIYPSNYAKNIIQASVRNSEQVNSIVIPHGIHESFFKKITVNKSNNFKNKPIRLLYVSIIDVYKHQWHVVHAVKLLRDEGFMVELDLIGPVGNDHSLKLLKKAIQQVDPDKTFIHVLGEVSHHKLPDFYAKTDIFVFASSCESISIIIQEAMAAGLPIACSNKGAMSELLKDAGIYFDPENPYEIAAAIKSLLTDLTLRTDLAARAKKYSEVFKWSRCTLETFSFCADMAKLQKKS